MMPTLALVGIEGSHRMWLPLPALLLWPLWPLGWAVWLGMWIFRDPRREALRLFLKGSARLSGLRVEIETRQGHHIFLRMI